MSFAAPTASERDGAIRGAEIKTMRADLKRRLSTGELHIADLLTDVPTWAEEMRLFDALRSLRGIRKTKAEKALNRVRLTSWTTLGAVTDHQRTRLLEYFEFRHPSLWELWRVMAKTGRPQ